MIVLDYNKIERMAADRGQDMKDVAQSIGYKNPSSLYDLRARGGRCRNKTAKRIADHFGVSVSEIAVFPEPELARETA